MYIDAGDGAEGEILSVGVMVLATSLHINVCWRLDKQNVMKP